MTDPTNEQSADQANLIGANGDAGPVGAAEGAFLPSSPSRTGRNGRPILTIRGGEVIVQEPPSVHRCGSSPTLNVHNPRKLS